MRGLKSRGPRMDAVFYLLDAMRLFRGKSLGEDNAAICYGLNAALTCCQLCYSMGRDCGIRVYRLERQSVCMYFALQKINAGYEVALYHRSIMPKFRIGTDEEIQVLSCARV